VTSRGFEDGTIDDLPWATVFDPAANARALSAIQAEGFRAASRIIDRFVRTVGSNGRTADGAGPAGPQEFERLARAWWSTVGQFLLRSMPARESGAAVALDVNNPGSRDALTLEASPSGSARAEVWLHNRGSEGCPDVRLQSSDLLSHDGALICADAVLMDIAVVSMPRRSSRGVAITVNVAPGVRPGVYRGTLLAVGHPGLWLPVVLTVRARNR
jgi:hypothetical protein